MAQSLSLMYVHIVFHISGSSVPIQLHDTDALYNYTGGVLKKQNCHPVRIGGMPDHIHILCVLSKNSSLANLVRDIKRSTTMWLKSKEAYYRHFRWQGGYGAFSVGVSSYAKTVKYIENQAIHHRKVSFKKEYELFLKESGMEYNEDYLWNE